MDRVAGTPGDWIVLASMLALAGQSFLQLRSLDRLSVGRADRPSIREWMSSWIPAQLAIDQDVARPASRRLWDAGRLIDLALDRSLDGRCSAAGATNAVHRRGGEYSLLATARQVGVDDPRRSRIGRGKPLQDGQRKRDEMLVCEPIAHRL